MRANARSSGEVQSLTAGSRLQPSVIRSVASRKSEIFNSLLSLICVYLRVSAVAFFLFWQNLSGSNTFAAERPNILWLTSEDHGPHLGCYGDQYAQTPNVDRLAERGTIYTRVWSCAPVCAPARTALISGMYPTSTGSEHMRSMVRAYYSMFPVLLREEAGYYCTNNSKEDYNLGQKKDYNQAQDDQVWDESSRKAHWKNREGEQPFFAVFNSERSHESRIRARPHKLVHDPARAPIPPYHPDTPEVRRDWAQYYDGVTNADADAGQRLKELEEAGLADDTIVFYFADHGSGMPRSKRWPYNSGLHVPLVIYVPEKWRHLAGDDYKPGGRTDRMVSFVDFAPTVLSLAGLKPEHWMQGRAFLGRFAGEPQKFLHGFRGRMDEKYDLVRSVTDGRYVYVRNYMPHLIYGQYLEYTFQTPTTRVWKKLHDEGKLTPVQDRFWQTKPPEELYDLQTDPHEIHNLADDPRFADIKERLRTEQREQIARVRDIGFLPEGELFSRAERGAGEEPFYRPAYCLGYTMDERMFKRIVDAAELASMLDKRAIPELKGLLGDHDSAVRYWAALGILMRGREAVDAAKTELLGAMHQAHVGIVAAQALAMYSEEAVTEPAIRVLLDDSDCTKSDVFTSMAALNALIALRDKSVPYADAILALPRKGPVPHPRYEPYVSRLLLDFESQVMKP